MNVSSERDKRKKIYVLTSAHIARDTRIFHKECKSLCRAGYHVTLIAPHPRQETIDGIEVAPLPLQWGRFGRVFNNVRILTLALRSDADIYHLHDLDLLVVGALLRLFRHKPVIYDVHELYVELVSAREWIPVVLRPVFRKFVDWGERFWGRWMSAFITVIDAQRERYSRYRVPVITIYNYPLRSTVPEDVTPVPEDPSVKPILYIGDITMVRGVWVLVEAFRLVVKELPHVELLLVGRIGEPAMHERLHEFIDKHELTDRVKMPGFIAHDRLGFYLRQASVGVVPYRNESQYSVALPTKLFEYMAYGLPVVASDLPGVHNLVKRTQCGLLAEPGNPVALADCLLTLLRDRDLVESMGAAGRRAVIEKYNWETEEEKLVALYEQLLTDQ